MCCQQISVMARGEVVVASSEGEPKAAMDFTWPVASDL